MCACLTERVLSIMEDRGKGSIRRGLFNGNLRKGIIFLLFASVSLLIPLAEPDVRGKVFVTEWEGGFCAGNTRFITFILSCLISQ